MRKKRVISLLPAATEMICALGAGDQLVGRSHECDYPPEVRGVPVCTATKIDFNAGPPAGGTSSGEINRRIGELMKATGSLYRLDAEQLRRLEPDLIITQAQCEACAVSLREVEEIVSRWPGNHPQIIPLSPNRLADIWEDIRSVANALELGEHGRTVLRGLKNRVVNIIEKSCVITKRPTVACIEWMEPLMVAGNWVPELVDLAGGANIIGDPGKHSAWMNWETLHRHNPEIIIVMPCGFDLERIRSEMRALASQPEWSRLNAVKQKRVFLADGSQYFNRPGPRVVESLEILAEIIHPGRFNFGHQGKGWEHYDEQAPLK